MPLSTLGLSLTKEENDKKLFGIAGKHPFLAQNSQRYRILLKQRRVLRWFTKKKLESRKKTVDVPSFFIAEVYLI
jgi:hypothetical protein